MKRAYFELAVREPGLVAWYCAVKLEMAVALTQALLTEQLRLPMCLAGVRRQRDLRAS